MLPSYRAGPVYLLVMFPNRRLLFKTIRSSSTKGNHHPSFLQVSGIGQKKILSMQPKFVAAQKMLLKLKPQTFVNGLLGFITLGIYTPLEARVLLTIIAAELPIDSGNSICTAH